MVGDPFMKFGVMGSEIEPLAQSIQRKRYESIG